MCIEVAKDARAFEVYVEHFLAPSPCEGQVVVKDNFGTHQPSRIRDLIEVRGLSFCSCRPTRRTVTP